MHTLAKRSWLGLVAVAMVLPSLLTWLYFVALRSHPAGLQQAVYTVGKTIQFGLPLAGLLFLRMPGCPWFRRSWAGVGSGLVFGGLVFGLILVGYQYWPSLAPVGAEIQDRLARIGIADRWQYAALAAFYAALHSFLEEYYWRWFVFGQLRRWLRPVSAAVLSSLAFAAHHVIVLGCYFGASSPSTALFSLGVAMGGAAWCGIYHRSNSLLGPWLSHAIVDAAIFAVGYQMVRGPMHW
jgi:uncharacterized protein